MKRILYKISIIIAVLLFINVNKAEAQCCAVGGGTPIASDLSQSVLCQGQMELSSNYQTINTRKFLSGSSEARNFLKRYRSEYLYSKISYGVTKDLTVSVESGYWLNKTQEGLDNSGIIKSKGIADLIIFPRLNVYNRYNTEITVGLGLKIPMGHYNDSTANIEPFSGEKYYLIKPPALQNSSGSNDFIFNLACTRRFPTNNFRLFLNLFYIRKGWNPAGEKFGDYASVDVFGGKTIKKKLTAILHLKYESIDRIHMSKEVSFPGFDYQATGSQKLFIVPQINYMINQNFNYFISSDIPLHQYVNKTQIASQFQITTGLSYRFFVNKSKTIIPEK